MSQSKLVILSDIHANLSALNAVIEHFTQNYTVDGVVFLGDLVNYGMRPNETIERFEGLSQQVKIVCALRGNHDDAMLHPEKHLSHFSTDRGRSALNVMTSMINDHSKQFIKTHLHNDGCMVCEIASRKILCVHGDIEKPLWGKMQDTNNAAYNKFDYVLSGHSHKPHLIEEFFDADNSDLRGKKKTTFINPGSVGQPRNHNQRAQYVYLDIETQTIHFNAVAYDIDREMSLYNNQIDTFYKTRLKKGI